VLNLLQFNPPEVTDGGTTTLTIQATDDLSGVGSVKGAVSSPNGTAILPFQAQDDGSSDGVFIARIAIPAGAETGLWYVSGLLVLDRAYNSLVTNYTPATVPPAGTIRVSSSMSDSTPPTVRSVWVEKPTLSGGEINTVRVEVQDDLSGVAAVTGMFQSPSKSALVAYACAADADPAFWVGAVSVPVDAECGRWTLKVLRTKDNAGNTAALSESSPQAAAAAFVVAGGSCDSTPPTLEQLGLSPAIVSNDTANEILVTAELADPGGRAIAVSGWIAGPVSTNGLAPKILFSCNRASNDPNAPWTGRISVPQYAAKGIWRIGLIRLQDKSLSYTEYAPQDAVLANGFFEVR
jgi:hypothetical protein